MHSTQFTRLAQAADEFGFTIVAFVELAPAEGTHPAAYCLLHDPDRPASRAYATSMGVLPDDGEAFFCSSSYDMDRVDGLHSFQTDVLREFNSAADNRDALGEVS
jgi:hypothetical protein